MIRNEDVHDVLRKHTIGDGLPIIVDPLRSLGSYVVDARTGTKYLDCMSMFASQPLGWNHPSFNDHLDRFRSLLSVKIALSDVYVREYAEFVEAFKSITPDFRYYFFIDTGTLGVENALKCAFDYKMKKMGWDRDAHANILDVIHLEHAFHGRSGYTLSLTNTKPVKTWGYPKFRWTRLPAPNDGEEASLAVAQNALERGNVAAVIVEPIQGEGGDIHFRPQYLQGLRSLARKYDALFIVDEVQTGVGLTGKMWGYEHFDLQPDLMCFGKKTQVCGCCATHKVDEVTKHVFNDSGRINSTWGGNILDMIRFTILSEIIVREKWVENAAKVGDYLLDKLRNANVPIRNVRGRGLMIAFDPIDQGEAYCRLSDRMLMLKSGDRSIRLRPPLTFSMEDADEAVKIIASL
jgi:L-lysine 6-transaminase